MRQMPKVARVRICTCVLGTPRDDDVSKFFRLKKSRHPVTPFVKYSDHSGIITIRPKTFVGKSCLLMINSSENAVYGHFQGGNSDAINNYRL